MYWNVSDVRILGVEKVTRTPPLDVTRQERLPHARLGKIGGGGRARVTSRRLTVEIGQNGIVGIAHDENDALGVLNACDSVRLYCHRAARRCVIIFANEPTSV